MPLPTPPRQPDTVPVLNATPLPAFTQAWQLQPPNDALIVVAKGTFDLVPGAPATPAEEPALPVGPEPFPDADEALRYPGDMAFFKPRCDVLVAGHAYASPRGGGVRRVEVRLGSQLSYAIAAIGERRWIQGAPSAPAPFEKIELRPERAFGGPGDPLNPVGVGRLAEDGRPLPSFELPDKLIRSLGDRPAPALLTPIAETWPSRAKLVGTYGGDWVTKRAPYFPDDFRWEYFQAAPPPLQIAYPRDDEWYHLPGLRPNDEVLEGRLPCLKLRAFAQPRSRPDELLELPLNLDTVFFEPDLLRVQLVWRGAIGVADPYGSDLASVFVMAELIGQPTPLEALRWRFAETYAAAYVRVPNEVEPDAPTPEPERPEGALPPVGLDAHRARALGLPAWTATIESPPLPAAPPPPPQAALTPSEVDALLASGRSLADVDLSYCDLRGRDLRGRDLGQALLLSAWLDGANLQGARLAGAVLTEASLVGADLRGADLTRAVLDGASVERAALDGAMLREASLARANLRAVSAIGATLDGASAAEADWIEAKLDGASLVGADFTGARLEGVSLVAAKMSDVRLYEVHAPRLIADDADLTQARLDGARLMGSSLARIKAPRASLRACDFTDANLAEAVLEEAVLEDAILDRANMNQVEAKACRWQRARAQEATFVKSNLMNGMFESVRFERCDLRGANLYDAETFRARFDGCRLDHAILAVSGIRS